MIELGIGLDMVFCCTTHRLQKTHDLLQTAGNSLWSGLQTVRLVDGELLNRRAIQCRENHPFVIRRNGTYESVTRPRCQDKPGLNVS